MEYKIESGISIPQYGSKNKNRKYPFPNMIVGDSFEFEESKRKTIATVSTWYGKRHNQKFSIRKTSEDKCRIWRIE